jgi:hypothetical protein
MNRLGRDKLRKRATSFGVDRSQAACRFEAFDLVKEIGQTCDRSATVRPARRTLNRRMVTAAEPVYSTCTFKNTGGVCKRHDTLESTSTATGSPVACDWRTDGII